MRFIADVDGVSLQEVEDFGKSLGGSGGDGRWEDGRGSDQALAVETWEQILRTGEEDGETEGEEVGRVAGRREDLARDLELAVAD